MSSIVYSPTSKINIDDFNESSLKDLKYHQLLKLSSKYNIKKRWAKKDDLIKCLLAVKSTTHTSENAVNEKIEWIDGQEMFKNLPPDNSSIRTSSSRRSTFIIEKGDIESRGTYYLSSAINDLLPEFNSPSSRLTFDIPKKEKPQNGKANIKMLTVPITSKASRGTTSRITSVKESPLKLSNKSIAIKKPKDVRSPMKAARILNSDLRSRRPLSKDPIRSNDPSIAKFDRFPIKPCQKENITVERKSMPRRKSKSDDPTERRSSVRTRIATPAFRTPPAAPPRRPQSQNKADAISGFKPLTSNKMPNFAAIHQRQFQKLDSLDEYINKKSDRVKMLFGTPTQCRPVEKGLVQNKASREVKDITIKTPKKVKTSIDDARKLISRNPQLRTMTDVKDKNRSHIHGIRSNRRFELQMKFRKIDAY